MEENLKLIEVEVEIEGMKSIVEENLDQKVEKIVLVVHVVVVVIVIVAVAN